MSLCDSRWITGLGVAALCGIACTDGTATALVALSTAGGGGSGHRAGASATAGATAGVGGAGGRVGSGSPPGPRGEPECPDPPGEEPTRELTRPDEDALLSAVNDAIADGKFCPGQRLSPLVPDPAYYCAARAAASPRSPRRPAPGWTRYQAWVEGWLWSGQGETVADIKDSLFAERRDELCEAARHTTFRLAGVGRRGNVWVLLITE